MIGVIAGAVVGLDQLEPVLEMLMERLSALTVDRLTDLSARLFSTKPTLTAVGPIGTLAPYEAVLDALPRSHATAHRLAV